MTANSIRDYKYNEKNHSKVHHISGQRQRKISCKICMRCLNVDLLIFLSQKMMHYNRKKNFIKKSLASMYPR